MNGQDCACGSQRGWSENSDPTGSPEVGGLISAIIGDAYCMDQIIDGNWHFCVRAWGSEAAVVKCSGRCASSHVAPEFAKSTLYLQYL